MNPGSTIGRNELSTRFTANVRIAYISQPTSNELFVIYTEYVKTLLENPLSELKGKQSNPNIAKHLSKFLISFYNEIKKKFSVDDHRHYLFTPRNITKLIYSLFRYPIKDNLNLIEAIAFEISKIFKDRLVGHPSLISYNEIV